MKHLVNLAPRECALLRDGSECRGLNALGNNDRALIDDGTDPNAKALALRDGRTVVEGMIAAFAGRQWASRKVDPRLRPWHLHAGAQMPPRLVAWATENYILPSGLYGLPARTQTAQDKRWEARNGGL